jgi:hypothetical protein
LAASRLITSAVCPALAARPPIAAAMPPEPMMLIVLMCSLLVTWVVNLRIVSCGIGVDGSGPGFRPKELPMLDQLAAASSTSISSRILENSQDPVSSRSSQAEALPVTKVSANSGPTVF